MKQCIFCYLRSLYLVSCSNILQLHLWAPKGQVFMSHQLKVLSTIFTYFFVLVCLWMCVSVCAPGVMLSRRWRFSWDRNSEVDLFTDRSETGAETLSQAIRAAVSEEPDADGSVLFGHLQGTVVGLRYYTGVVSINQGHLYSSSALIG